ncbi:MAG: flagellar basal body rod protein FlgB [Nitrospirota bacterium]|nr:flagellar basal body rod protein FlgB [Nitrospirota bacterium]
MADSLFGGTIGLLGKSMDIRSQRHAVLSSNIANAETPGYKSKDISFENELSKAMGVSTGDMKKTHPNHLSGDTESMMTAQTSDSEGTLRNDDNDVSVDEEMSKLAQNTLQYNTSAQILAKKFAGLKYAISEGRR